MGTVNGPTECTEYCVLSNIALPEITYTQHCLKMKCYIINSKINYDVIIGRKFMSEAQFKLDFSTNTVSWYDKEMSFHARSYFNDMCLIEKCTSNEPIAVAEMYTAQAKRVAYVDSSTKYEETDLIHLAQNQKHLDEDTRGELQSMLLKNAKLFASLEGRTLGFFLIKNLILN